MKTRESPSVRYPRMVRDMEMLRRSAIIVPMRLPADLEAIRRREVASARAGAPAHVTLLFPFVPAARLTASDLDGVAAAVASVPAFEVWLRKARRWDPSDGAPEGVAWLDPEPAAPFITLTNALGRAFPDYRPYGGMHDTIIPHLTLASDDRRQLRTVQSAAAAALPFRRHVSAAILIVEGRDGRWRTRRRFPLASRTVASAEPPDASERAARTFAKPSRIVRT
jgi:2'-5' RNA ligase